MKKTYHLILVFLLSFFFSTIASAAQNEPLSPQIKAQIKQEVEAGIQRYMNGPAFNQQVEKGIFTFIAKRNKEARNRRLKDAQRGNQASKVNPEKDHILGNPKAKYSLIEYSDFECPFCKRFHPTAHEFIAKNTDVNWVYRNFPLSFHGKAAQKEAEAGECAAELGGNNTFWKFADGIFSRTRSNGLGIPNNGMAQLAKDVGLNPVALAKCIKNAKFKNKIAAQIQDGSNAGVTGTPGNFLRYNPTGITLAIPGAQPLQNLQAAFAELRRRVKAQAK